MPSTIQVGTIVMKMKEWSLMTQLLGLESEPCSGNWSLVKALDSFALDRKIHAAGWNFFFMAAEVKVIFFCALGTNKDTQRVKTNSGEGEASKLQRPRSNWNRCQALSGCAMPPFPHTHAISNRAAAWIAPRHGRRPVTQSGPEVERVSGPGVTYETL